MATVIPTVLLMVIHTGTRTKSASLRTTHTMNASIITS
jgi:hypothetical protein